LTWESSRMRNEGDVVASCTIVPIRYSHELSSMALIIEVTLAISTLDIATSALLDDDVSPNQHEISINSVSVRR
jgi:hypothetical protein